MRTTMDSGRMPSAGLLQFRVSPDVHEAVRLRGGQGNLADGLRVLLLGVALACEQELSSDDIRVTKEALTAAYARAAHASQETQRLKTVRSDLRRAHARLRAADEKLRKKLDQVCASFLAAKEEEARCQRMVLALVRELEAVEVGIGRQGGARTVAVRLDPMFRDIARCLEGHYELTLRQIVYRALRTPAVTELCQQIRRMSPAEHSAVVEETHRIWTSPTMSSSALGVQGVAAVG